MNYKEAHKAARNSNFSDNSLDNLFIAEQIEHDQYETERKYAGLTNAQKKVAMQDDYDEISACNDVYDYYN